MKKKLIEERDKIQIRVPTTLSIICKKIIKKWKLEIRYWNIM